MSQHVFSKQLVHIVTVAIYEYIFISFTINSQPRSYQSSSHDIFIVYWSRPCVQVALLPPIDPIPSNKYLHDVTLYRV
jgi:hypothetical protein